LTFILLTFLIQLMKRISIMLIDDHTLIRETWRSLLFTIENMEIVAECGDGRMAGELAKNKRPDVVLLDVNMQPLDGFEVLKIIRKLSPLSKVIGLTMRSEPANVKKFLRLGAKGYVTKNSPRDELIYAIEEVHKGNIYICAEVKALLAQKTIEGDSPAPDLSGLSDSELKVLSLLCAGESSKEIAVKFGISIKTIEVHRHNILKKMKVKNTIALILYVNSHAFEI
jgi:two-component system, NarL family, invasion response regulator UvrY